MLAIPIARQDTQTQAVGSGPTVARAYVDGAKKGKTVVIGGICYAGSTEVFRYSEIAGSGNNADAEFRSLIRCLELASELGIFGIVVHTDAKQIVDSLKSRAEVVHDLLSRIEQGLGDANGMFRALACITGRRLPHKLPVWRRWFDENRQALEKTRNVSPATTRYADVIDRLCIQVAAQIVLVDREQTGVAHDLCRRAKAGLTSDNERALRHDFPSIVS